MPEGSHILQRQIQHVTKLRGAVKRTRSRKEELQGLGGDHRNGNSYYKKYILILNGVAVRCVNI